MMCMGAAFGLRPVFLQEGLEEAVCKNVQFQQICFRKGIDKCTQCVHNNRQKGGEHMNRKQKRRKSTSDKLKIAALVLAVIREIIALIRELID